MSLVYAVGGSSSTPLPTLEAYDPRNDSWSKLPDMPTARLGLAAAVGTDGRIYAIGGGDFDAATRRATVEAYDPATKKWTTMASMPTARTHLAAVTGQDGRIYALGGIVGPLVQDALSTVEAYTPGTNSWATVASMPTKRAFLAAAVASDGRIFALGGQTSPAGGPSADVYTPSSNSWTTIPNMPTPRQALAAATTSDGIIALGGLTAADVSTYSALNTRYVPFSNTWSARAAMPTPRSFFAAVSVEGRVYAIGGQRKATDPRLSTVEVYKP